MGFHIMADLIGSADHRKDLLEESIYLLREDYKIIGMRRATHPTGPSANIGDLFFERFTADPKELRTLFGMTNFYNEHSLLMRAGNRPVIILLALYARTRLLVAVVPEGEARRALEHPAQHAELLAEDRLLCSPQSLQRKEALTEQDHRTVHAFVQRIHDPLFYDRIHHLEPKAPLLNAVMRLHRIAALCGCAVDFDLSGVEHVAEEQGAFDLLVGASLALLMAVHRTGADRHLTLTAGNVPGCGPMAGGVFSCTVPKSELCELQHLCQEAEARGERFEITTHPERPERVMVQFALRHKELSEQGIKRPLPEGFSEGLGHLPYGVPDDVFEES